MEQADIQFVRAIPIIPVGDEFDQALTYYEKKLGFERTWIGGGFADLRMGAVHIMLQQFGDQPFRSNYMVRIEVRGVENYYRQLHERGVTKLGKLETKPWGTYEFHLLDPGGVLIAFVESSS